MTDRASAEGLFSAYVAELFEAASAFVDELDAPPGQAEARLRAALQNFNNPEGLDDTLDRASAEGLRRYRAIINANGAMEFIEDPDGALVTYADVAALRDTGPRPDSGIDDVIASLTSEDEIAHGEAWDDVRKMGLGSCAYCDDEWPCRTQRGIDALLARLSTPETSEQKPAGWSTGEPWNPDGVQP